MYHWYLTNQHFSFGLWLGTMMMYFFPVWHRGAALERKDSAAGRGQLVLLLS